jgi:hydroxyacylglutathione hydrolase
VLLGDDPGQIVEVNRQLLRVGLDDVAGYVEGGFEAWRAAGARVAAVELVTARELRDRLTRRERLTVIDVRTHREWLGGHIDNAISVPIGELAGRADELRGPDPVATVCETGYRSSLAASLLARAGLHVVNVSDGTAAYRMLA